MELDTEAIVEAYFGGQNTNDLAAIFECSVDTIRRVIKGAGRELLPAGTFKARTPFWDRVTKGAEDACWPWQGRLCHPSPGHGSNPYGRYLGGKMAHRVAYELAVGPIPPGLTIDHLCRNTLCCNPAHLEVVTQAENNRRAAAYRTHCKHGHEFTPENTAIQRGNSRHCRTCNREAVRRYKARKNAQLGDVA